MSVAGLCSVCESREATRVCERCGAAVCEVHYDPGAGVCADCAAGMGAEGNGSPDNRGDSGLR